MSAVVPAQTVTIIVPYTAGGAADVAARTLEKTLSKRLSYNFVVEYQIGAGGIIAANNVAKNHNKENVLLLHSSAIATNSFNPNSTYNLLQDFIPVAKLGSVPMVLVSSNNSNLYSVKQLRSLKESSFYGSGGVGTAGHVAGEILQQQINQNLLPVFYKGELTALNDVLTNIIPMMFVSISTATNYAKSNQIKLLAVTGTQRSKKIPTVPTFAEQGIKNFERSPSWFVVLANPGADVEVIRKIKAAVIDSFNNAQDIDLYDRAGVELNSQPVAAVLEFLAEEIEKIRPFQSKLKQ